MEDVRIIEVKRSVYADNDLVAAQVREKMKEENTFLLNMMSSPGSGKTSTLLALAKELEGKLRWGVMEADIDSAVDAEALVNAGIHAIQIHTGGACHLDADMTRQGLAEIGSADLDMVILENVGNLVCTAGFDTGSVKNMTILSVPEGDDKPLKYPRMYEICDLLVVNKTDVLEYFDFDCERLEANAKLRNPKIEILYVSARTGEGMEALAQWILREANGWNR